MSNVDKISLFLSISDGCFYSMNVHSLVFSSDNGGGVKFNSSNSRFRMIYVNRCSCWASYF